MFCVDDYASMDGTRTSLRRVIVMPNASIVCPACGAGVAMIFECNECGETALLPEKGTRDLSAEQEEGCAVTLSCTFCGRQRFHGVACDKCDRKCGAVLMKKKAAGAQ